VNCVIGFDNRSEELISWKENICTRVRAVRGCAILSLSISFSPSLPPLRHRRAIREGHAVNTQNLKTFTQDPLAIFSVPSPSWLGSLIAQTRSPNTNILRLTAQVGASLSNRNTVRDLKFNLAINAPQSGRQHGTYHVSLWDIYARLIQLLTYL
jgi:hypothetical protein